jgi:GntR family transcriptional regulator
MADPMYRQIADDLRRRIQAGDLQPGEQLPTELELRDTYDASRNTVRDAIRMLVSSGLVVTRAGQGTFVADQIVPFRITMSTDPQTGLGGGEGGAYISEAKAQARKPTTSPVRVEIQAATSDIATELQVEEGSSVVLRHQQLHLEEKPWALQTSFYPGSYAERAPQLFQAKEIQPGAVHYLGETLGLHQVGYQDRVTARAPNDHEAGFFRLRDVGTSVIETVRTAYDDAGKPLRCTVTVWAADRNHLVYSIGKVPRRDDSGGG